MNIKINNKKNKTDLRFVALMAVGSWLGGCAYEPGEGSRANGGESQATNFSDDISTDIVVSDRFVLKGAPEKIRRLTILDGGVLLTNGADLDLSVREIVSFNGTIDTTPLPSTREGGANGRPGGMLHLNALNATGKLKVIAGGEDGAPGTKGAEGAPGSQGSAGQNASLSYTEDCLFSYNLLNLHGPDGPGRCSKSWFCRKETGDGGQGVQGGTGQTGLSGGNGGDSSPMLIELENPSGFLISTEARPGKGGVGGQGGDGGPGGPGGNPGARDSSNLCRAANQGPQGSQGVRGLTGMSGRSGNELPACLRLGATLIGACGAFERNFGAGQ